MNKRAGSREHRWQCTNVDQYSLSAGDSYCPSWKIYVPYVEPNQSTFKLERIADQYIPKQGEFDTRCIDAGFAAALTSGDPTRKR